MYNSVATPTSINKQGAKSIGLEEGSTVLVLVTKGAKSAGLVEGNNVLVLVTKLVKPAGFEGLLVNQSFQANELEGFCMNHP